MGFKCGIVGLPNVGKSTLFNALTSSQAAEAANFPFCTIEPNVGVVSVPDPRLYKLSSLANSKKTIPTQIEFVDIAGLVAGASKGEGLGNKFLAHIREVDAVVYVLRCFEDADVTHVEGGVDPIRDASVIETELILADLESLQNRLPALEKKSRGQSELKEDIEVAKQLIEHLNQGLPARQFINEDNAEIISRLQLLTTKPIMYVCNVEEDNVVSGNQFSKRVEEEFGGHAAVVTISAKIESEIANLDDQEERAEFLESVGLSETGLSKIIRGGYDILGLITFFTVGEKEAHAWTVRQNAKAPTAAGVIHTDFEHGFIRAETMAYDDYLEYGSESKVKDAGKLRLEGKDYLVQDGDIIHFRFNV